MGAFDTILGITDRAVQTMLSGTNETMTYTPSAGPAVENVPVLFDDDTGTQKPYQQQAEFPKPRVWVRLEDIAPYDPRTDEPTLTIRGQDYKIHQRPADGQIGNTLHLKLHKTS